MMWKLIYPIFNLSLALSLALGGFLSDDKSERIFLVSAGVAATILTVKFIYILWRKEQILAFLDDISVHCVTGHDEFIQIDKKVNKLMKFGSCVIFMLLAASLIAVIFLPLFSTEKALPLNVAFPWDWKNSQIAYWIAFAFAATGYVFGLIGATLNVVIWYLMMNCSIKYHILGNQLRNLGLICRTKATEERNKITEVEKPKLFLNELIRLIKIHQNIQETINRFKSCFSALFFAQITTSGICICGGVYALAFTSNESSFRSVIYIMFLVYNIFDIFMVMYFGNEIKLSSHRLSYCLFESNWNSQSRSYKKCIIILSEVLKQPHELIIGQLYPLDLEMFLAILKLVYSMFSILRNIN